MDDGELDYADLHPVWRILFTVLWCGFSAFWVIDVISDGHFNGGDMLITRNANPYLFWFGVGVVASAGVGGLAVCIWSFLSKQGPPRDGEPGSDRALQVAISGQMPERNNTRAGGSQPCATRAEVESVTVYMYP